MKINTPDFQELLNNYRQMGAIANQRAIGKMREDAQIRNDANAQFQRFQMLDQIRDESQASRMPSLLAQFGGQAIFPPGNIPAFNPPVR